jgi:hypothetical protein
VSAGKAEGLSAASTATMSSAPELFDPLGDADPGQQSAG